MREEPEAERRSLHSAHAELHTGGFTCARNQTTYPPREEVQSYSCVDSEIEAQEGSEWVLSDLNSPA